MEQNWLKTAVILTAGWGTRRLPITKTIEKNMLPVGNRPLIDFAVQDALSVGIEDIYIVVSSAERSQIRDYYSQNLELEQFLQTHGKAEMLPLVKTLPDGVRLHFVEQGYPGRYGAAIALVSAIEAGGLTGPLWVCMGDNFIWNPGGKTASQTMVAAIAAAQNETGREDVSAQAETGREDVSAMLGVEVPREEVSRYGVLSVDATGNLTGIVEKPSVEAAPSNLISPGYYVFSPRLVQLTLDYVHQNDFAPGEREYLVPDFAPGEREYLVPDPIAEYLAEGGLVRTVPAEGTYLDGGTLEGWLHANQVVCKEAWPK